MKTLKRLFAILVAAVLCAAWPAVAQTATTTQTTNAPTKRIPTRYAGMIASIDTTNMILTLKATARTPESKVKVTSTTKITKDKEPAQFSDAVAGVRVSGSGKKGDDGTWTATTLNIVTKPKAPKTPPAAVPPAPSK